MKTKTELSETGKKLLAPVGPATQTVTLRVTEEYISFLDELVASGLAKSKTEAIFLCITRCRDSYPAEVTMTALEASNRALVAKLEAMNDSVLDAADEVSAVKSMCEKDLAVLNTKVDALINLRLWGPAAFNETMAEVESGAGGRVVSEAPSTPANHQDASGSRTPSPKHTPHGDGN
jgi:Arc/MetJ-type ribon-helix-helix transcriptional regulator